MALTRSGSWGSGSGALPGSQSPCRTRGCLKISRRALPDFAAEDNVGSPYCVRRYVVDEHLGGPEGLAAARKELAKRGLRLILDFVPEPRGPGPSLGRSNIPNILSRGTTGISTREPASFVEEGGKVFACGRDPYFPAWPDVLQLNAFHPGLRQAVIETVLGYCRPVRRRALRHGDAADEHIFSSAPGASGQGQGRQTEYWPR